MLEDSLILFDFDLLGLDWSNRQRLSEKSSAVVNDVQGRGQNSGNAGRNPVDKAVTRGGKIQNQPVSGISNRTFSTTNSTNEGRTNGKSHPGS